jgi:hypothetical protein
MLGTVLDPRGSKPSEEPMAHFRFYVTTPNGEEWGPLGPDLAFVYTKKAVRSTTFPVIIVSISVCTIISKRPASPMTSTVISSAVLAARLASLQPIPSSSRTLTASSAWPAKAAGIETRIGNHTFRATGIAAYLKNSGKLEVAQQIANHESPRTTKLYDRRQDEISLDEIERITILKKPGVRIAGHSETSILGHPGRFEYSARQSELRFLAGTNSHGLILL